MHRVTHFLGLDGPHAERTMLVVAGMMAALFALASMGTGVAALGAAFAMAVAAVAAITRRGGARDLLGLLPLAIALACAAWGVGGNLPLSLRAWELGATIGLVAALPVFAVVLWMPPLRGGAPRPHGDR